MEPSKPAPPPAVLDALLEKLRAVSLQMRTANEMAKEAAEMQADAEADFQRIQSAAELWDINLMEEVKTRFAAETGQPAPETIEPPTAFSSERPTVLNFTLARAAAAYPEPVRAADLQREFERQYGQKVHGKTFGMTLYRASQMDPPLMRRDGRADWYFIPEDLRVPRRGYFPPPGAEDPLDLDDAPE